MSLDFHSSRYASCCVISWHSRTRESWKDADATVATLLAGRADLLHTSASTRHNKHVHYEDCTRVACCHGACRCPLSDANIRAGVHRE
jgi:hypothetical protein